MDKTRLRGQPVILIRVKLLLALALALPLSAQNLDIYWIDVEGGAATLVVSPSGETALMDSGWAGYDDRDPKRIAAVLRDQLKTDELDYFITSHFHMDHVGGVPALAKLVNIKKYVDHGDSVEQHIERGKKLWDAYLGVAKGKRMQVKPGDRLPLRGADFQFVAARSKFVDSPLGKAMPNPACAGAELRDPDDLENGKSVGFIVRVGKFEFLDLGDLTWNWEHAAACPQNLFGEIDLYQVTHHGMHMSGAPQHINAIKPKVAVMNNGPHKGGTPQTYRALTSTPSLEDLWQVHAAMHEGDSPNPDEKKIANLTDTEGCEGHWIKASVAPDGSFTVSNSRNGYAKTYQPR